jgi:hypothetical protein
MVKIITQFRNRLLVSHKKSYILWTISDCKYSPCFKSKNTHSKPVLQQQNRISIAKTIAVNSSLNKSEFLKREREVIKCKNYRHLRCVIIRILIIILWETFYRICPWIIEKLVKRLKALFFFLINVINNALYYYAFFIFAFELKGFFTCLVHNDL